MSILFLGGLFSPARKEDIASCSIGPAQNAANALQWSLVEGLDACNPGELSLLNAVFVGSYPRFYKKLYVRGARWSHRPGCEDIDIGFLNLFAIKQLARAASLARHTIAWARRDASLPKAIIAYSMHTPFLIALAAAKAVNPHVRTCLMVPDLPEFMNTTSSASLLYRCLKPIDMWVMRQIQHKVDCFAFLTEHMAPRLGVEHKPWIVVEGISDLSPPPEESPPCASELRTIVYTGTLNWAYGIGRLLEAFARIEQRNYRLVICGEGEARAAIEAAARSDGRITFFGQVDREKSREVQRQATVLVNPRDAEGDYTRYSFPSKLIEYLSSGRMVAAYKLPGIPKEYDDHLQYIPGSRAEEMATKLIELCELPPEARERAAAKARRFVYERTNARRQAERIIELVAPPK